jgi:hypothetical protein
VTSSLRDKGQIKEPIAKRGSSKRHEQNIRPVAQTSGLTGMIHIAARLAAARGRHLTGRVEYMMNMDEHAYRIDAEVTIPFEDFAAPGLDPDGGRDDEEVVLTISKLDFTLEMTRARIATTGVIFTAADAGTGVHIRAGDEIALEIQGKRAAAGRF